MIRKIKPTVAVLFYEDEIIPEIWSLTDELKFKKREILSVEKAKELFRALYIENKVKHYKGKIPNSVIYLDSENNTIVWSLPAKKRKLTFSDDLKDVIPSGIHHIPKMIFKIKGDTLEVFFKKPKDNRLYKSIYPNQYQKGTVCMGNVKIEHFEDVKETIDTITDHYFQSKFTHFIREDIIDGNAANEIKLAFNNKRSINSDLLRLAGCTINSISK